MSAPLQSYLNSAREAALQAGRLIKERFGKTHERFEKAPGDYVTETDRQAEKLIASLLNAHHPEVDFWGEESGHHDRGGRLCWIVDPLDGTKNFVRGYPFVATSIALVEGRRPLVGVVYAPLQDDLFMALRDGGAFRNGHRLQVSDTATLEEAVVVTNPRYLSPADRPRTAQQSMAFFERCLGVRRGGAMALDLCYVAAGAVDAMWEVGCLPWDVAAGCLLIEEAQGTITDLDGRPYRVTEPDLLVSNTRLHSQLVAQFARA